MLDLVARRKIPELKPGRRVDRQELDGGWPAVRH